jgi:dTDP-4-dehydrorhamnose reductase
MKILVVGANGMLGNACMNYFCGSKAFDVIGTIRSNKSLTFFSQRVREKIISGVDIVDEYTQESIFRKIMPDVVINCVGLIKQSKDGGDTYKSIILNSLLPHQLEKQCQVFNSRLLHISTDCVFSGDKKGGYTESDSSDAHDIYGRTKFLGEISNSRMVLTLRTSHIGNELSGSNGLLEWFLNQQDVCQGFTKAIYSGLPTVILMQVIEDILINHPHLSGLYQIASSPISKYDLLHLIAKKFQKTIRIVPNEDLVIDRSLNGSRFRSVTGFVAPSWDKMIEEMYLDRLNNVQK